MNELDSLRQEAETLKNAIRVSTLTIEIPYCITHKIFFLMCNASQVQVTTLVLVTTSHSFKYRNINRFKKKYMKFVADT